MTPDFGEWKNFLEGCISEMHCGKNRQEATSGC